jgi:hypothetical protein
MSSLSIKIVLGKGVKKVSRIKIIVFSRGVKIGKNGVRTLRCSIGVAGQGGGVLINAHHLKASHFPKWAVLNPKTGSSKTEYSGEKIFNFQTLTD